MSKEISGTFTIIIKQEENRYTIEAEGPAGIRVEREPFLGLDEWLSGEHQETLAALGRGEQPSGLSGRIAELGRVLHRALFDRARLAEGFGQARGGEGRKIRLCLQIEPPELAALPWETMYDGQAWLATRSNVPLVRRWPQAASSKIVEKLSLRGPLRILFVGASPHGLPKLKIEDSAHELQARLKNATSKQQLLLDVLLNATLDEVRQKLLREEYHILFFAGHGRPDALCFDDGQGDEREVHGRRERQAGDPDWVTAAELVRVLEGKLSSLRLLFLAACETSRMAAQSGGLQESFAQQLWNRLPIPAIVAMQYFISDYQAHILTSWFFEALAASYPVDIALAEARKTLIHNEHVGRDVFTPVLFMRSPDGRLFERADFDHHLATPPAPGESPYKGLRYFDEEDAHHFFGRERLTAELLNQLLEQRFLAVVGASGSGKSSLVRAGLIPACRRNAEGREQWAVHVITPTNQPLKALAASLTRDVESVTATATLMEDLAHDARSLDLYASKLLSRAQTSSPRLGPKGTSGAKGGRLLLVVDQFEELFTLCRDKSERQAFVDNLLTATAPPPPFSPPNPSASSGHRIRGGNTGPILVVIALRADFYVHCSQFDNLRHALERQQRYIGPMNGVELRQAIEKPANQEGWLFETGLVELLLSDVGNEPGALPLLSHALLETWERRQGRTLTFAGYHESGGVKGAIAQSADRIYKELTKQQQPIARAIFLQLTELGEGTPDTRRRVQLAELVQRVPAEDAPLVETLINTLADARLLTVFKDSVEVAHEALIREWPLLREWLDEDREGMRIHRRLTQDAQEWEKLNRDTGALYRGVMLNQALEWAKTHKDQLNHQERLYLDTSKELLEREKAEREAQRQRELEQAQALAEEAEARRQAEEERAKEAEARRKAEQQRAEEAEKREQEQTKAASRLRTRNRIITGVGIIAFLVALLAISFWNRANISANHNADLAATNQTVAQKNVAIASTAQAASTEVAQQRDEAKRQARITTARQLVTQAQSTSHTQRSLRLLLIIEALNVTMNQQEPPVPAAHQALRDALPNTGGIILRGHEASIRTLAISPDSHWLVTGALDGIARLWDLTAKDPSAQSLVLQDHNAAIIAIAIIPDNHWLVTASRDHTARVWDLSEKDPSAHSVVLGGHTAPIVAMAISPDSRWLATGSEDRTVRLWDLSATNPSVNSIVLQGHQGPVSDLVISPDNHWLATGSWDNRVRLWDLTAKDPSVKSIVLRGHQDHITAVAISSDNHWLLTGSRDKTARLWHLTATDPSAEPVILQGHQDRITAVAISSDNHWLITSSWDKTARLWDLTAKEPSVDSVVLQGHSAPIEAITISECQAPCKRNQWLVTGSLDGTARLWDLTAKDPSVEPVVLRGHENWIYAVAISPDNQWLVTGSRDHTARLWNLRVEELIVQACRTAGRNLTLAESNQYFLGENYRQTCENLPIHDTVVEPLITEGRSLAKTGDIDGAIAKFKEALALIPSLELEPEAEAKKIAGESLVQEGKSLAYQGDIDRALAKFQEGLEFAPNLETEIEATKRDLASTLVQEGWDLAREGDIDEAIAKFEEALALDASLELEPEADALTAVAFVEYGTELARQGDIEEALAKFAEAQALYSEVEIDARDWNALCWYGSLWGQAAEVMDACERAVELASGYEKEWIRERRGLARALTEDYAGALEDFQSCSGFCLFDSLTLERHLSFTRQELIPELEAGRNPFDAETLEALMNWCRERPFFCER
ncbi:MAG: CHAT domain-containing protein [Ardenticatenaceae bacterium]